MHVVEKLQRTLLDDKDREFDLEYTPAEWINPVVIDNEDGTVTVRYAVVDDHGATYDPMELEGITFIKFDNGQQRNDWIVYNLQTCIECGYDESSEHEKECEDDPHPFTPHFVWDDKTFWVERYEHGLVNYALTHESSQVDRQWDVASGVAVLQLDDDWTGDPTNVARQLLETYTAYCNGDVYGIIQQEFTFDPSADEWVTDSSRENACWGFIGTDYAEQSVKEGVF